MLLRLTFVTHFINLMRLKTLFTGCAYVSVLQSEATPGEDEMNPTVKRSGWHPPEDTGLWAIADRVALEVTLHTCVQ